MISVRPLSLVAVLLVVLGSAAILPATSAEAAAARSSLERRAEDVVTGLHNVARTDPGRFGYGGETRRAPMTGWTDLREVARQWSDDMGQRRQLAHNSDMGQEVCCAVASGENVGYRTLSSADERSVASAARAVFQAWMDSSGHRANIMKGGFDEFGVGARVTAEGSGYVLYLTVNFRDRDPAQRPDGVVYHRSARTISDTCDGSGSAGYSDVPSGSAHRATIDCISAHGIAKGDRSGRFSPAGRLNRAQLATFLKRMLAAGGVAIPAQVPDHFDDDDGDLHEHSLNVLAEFGVIDRSDRRVGPGIAVTREGMALWTAAALAHGRGIDPGRSVGDHFSDDEGSAAQAAINQLADAGVVTGAGDGTFSPRALLRRDQMATFLARGLDLLLDT
ncbi:MAG: S-layer homology domain-containing protein [Actinobacteria bacterium]|nr:S-layer homology domain-containing protein [Actinomycetota bacterium]